MEGGGADLQLRTTVPILCESANECSLSLDLYTISEGNIIDRGCEGGMDALVFGQTGCGANMAAISATNDWEQGWNQIQNGLPDKVTVKGASDGMMGVNRIMRIMLKSNLFLENDIWSHYQLDPVNVCFLLF